jgi:hypothetical protein
MIESTPSVVPSAQPCSRRSLLLGSLAFASLCKEHAGGTEFATSNTDSGKRTGGMPGLPHCLPKAKRVIYLFQSGGPAQMDLFDYKPQLRDRFGEEVPKSI